MVDRVESLVLRAVLISSTLLSIKFCESLLCMLQTFLSGLSKNL